MLRDRTWGFFIWGEIKMKKYEQLSYKEQLELFHNRGMKFDYSFNELDETLPVYLKNIQTISTLGYYQLKDYAYPYFVDGRYDNVDFAKIVARYYRDKHLRNAVEHAIEDIEATLNTRIAYLSGDKYGPFGYLEFRNWCQKEGKNKYIRNKKVNKYYIAKEQNKFLGKIPGKARRSSSRDVKAFDKNDDDQVYMPVWLMMNELTLGDSIYIVKLMSNRNRRAIAEKFECSVDELISWLECINLVRNICCHNGNLVDIKLVTQPKLPKDFEDVLYLKSEKEDSANYTNRLAIVICIVVKLMSSINIRYRFGNLINALNHLLDETNTPEVYGFRDKKAIYECFSKERELIFKE